MMPLLQTFQVKIKISTFRSRLRYRYADIKTKNLSIFDYEYPLDTFDYIIATEMMHHFTPLEKEYIYKEIIV